MRLSVLTSTANAASCKSSRIIPLASESLTLRKQHKLMIISVMKRLLCFCPLVLAILGVECSWAEQKTYCNPINIDYGYTPFERFATKGKHRTTADPVIVRFKDRLFLFSTNQEGYWHSEDMLQWSFVSRKFLRDDKYIHDLNAPAAG